MIRHQGYAIDNGEQEEGVLCIAVSVYGSKGKVVLECCRIKKYRLAHPEGFEPPTPGSEDQCSDPLSYGCFNDIVSSVSNWLNTTFPNT